MSTTDTHTTQIDQLREDVAYAVGADAQADRLAGSPSRMLAANIEAQQDAHGRIAETLEAMTSDHREARDIIASLGYERDTREWHNARQGLSLFRVWDMG